MVEKTQEWKPKFIEFCNTYENDLPSPVSLRAETEVWEYTWIMKKNGGKNIPDTIQSTLKDMDHDMFPNISVAMMILAVVPVTTCECERSVSTLRRMKNYMQTTMKEDRLNGLSLMYTHRNIPLNVAQLVDKFAGLHPRRLQLTDILAAE